MIRFEEPPHHGRTTRPDCTDADREFLTAAINRQLVGVDAEIWVHTCWGPPHQQRVYWEPPSHERALPYLLQLRDDVMTFECASTNGRGLPLFAKYPTDKKIGIGVVNHCNRVVDPPEHVARLIRKALEHIPPERLLITADCGFGREGLSRRIAYYEYVSLVEGTNIVRSEQGLPEARISCRCMLALLYPMGMKGSAGYKTKFDRLHQTAARDGPAMHVPPHDPVQHSSLLISCLLHHLTYGPGHGGAVHSRWPLERG